VVEERLAFQAPGLGEDELELQVPSYFITGRLGGAHSLQWSLGEPSPASRLEWISVGESLCCFWAGLPRPGLAFSLCLAASGPSPSMRRAVRLASRGLVFGSSRPALPLLKIPLLRAFLAAAFAEL
jgi:hypothetical protein